MEVTALTGISEEHVVYTSKFAANGEFDSEVFSLKPTDKCTEKWSVWLVKDSAYCFGEYNVQFNSENISDSVVAISYFDTTLSDKSCGNLIREFKIYNDNENILNMNAEEVYENNKTLLSDMDSKGYATLPSANSASATVKEGIWNSTESSKKIEIGSYNSTKNAYGLVSLSSINASDGEQFVLGANLYQTITTPADCESIKITFDGRRALTSNSSKNRLFVTNSTNIPSEDPDTKKTQFDYLTENSYFNNNCQNDGLTVIYTAKFAENGKFSVDINEAVSLEEDEIHTEKIYVYTYENTTNTKWENHGVEILNTSKGTEENLILYFNSTTYEGANNLLDNVQVSTGDFSMFEGDGTEQSPYLISDEEDFINFRELGMLATNIYFKQTDNIILTQPLEVGNTVSFYGIYDGDGYYISNLNASDSSSKGEVTLFHYLYGTVKNLGLKDVNYTSKFCASTIANYLYGTIENCWITGNISGDVYAAGIATGIGNYGQIKNSYFVGTVTSTNNFGAAAYRPGSTPTFVNVFSTTDVCISSKLASNVTPTITNCETKTEEEMKTQEFLDTLNQYVTENAGLTQWIFDENTGLPVFRQANIIPEITSLSANVNNENANILWMYDANTKEYNLYLPKLADRNNLIINVDYSVQQKEALVYDENDTKLGILKSGEANNYFANDKVILKFDDLIEYAKQYNQNIVASAKMNYTRWPYETMKQEHPSWYMGGNSFEESSQNLINDIETRVNFYKNEYKNLSINEIKYETIDVNGQKVEGSITLNGTSKIELPNTISLDAEVKLTGISDNNVERNMGTVNLTEGKYTGSIAVSNEINVELDKKYNRVVYSIEIQRLDSEIKSIEITKLPIKTEYIEGEKIDITGMVVTATYSDDTTSEITDYEINLKDELKISDEKVIVTYGGKSAEFEITVKENTVTKLEITEQPTKIEYIEGQNFDATGMVIKGILLDGTEKEITDYTIENGRGLSKNIKEVEIKYGKFSMYVPITVKENIVTKIAITKQPDKTQYFIGESFDKTGMIVTATFLDGTKKEITNYQITKTDALGIKDKIITIECDGMTADIAITVKEIVYTVLEGENRKFIKNYDKDISIKIDADVTLFQKVFIDDEEIDKSNYVITSGSTIVTLKQSYLNQLSVGTHTMKTVFTDGGVAYSTITIIEEDADKNNLDKGDTNLENNTNITSTTPKTGDTILTFVTMFIISVLGIVITLKYKKSQRSGKH